MSETAKQPGMFARAEAGTRHVMLMIGAGIIAYVVGSIIVSQLSAGLAERFERIESPAVAFVVYWALTRFWLLLVLPAFVWLGARFLPVGAAMFAATAVVSGELFDLLLTTARLGVEGTFATVEETIARVLTLALGLGIAVLAARRGRRAAEASAKRAQAKAEAAKAEYAEFLRRAEQGGPGAATTAPAAAGPATTVPAAEAAAPATTAAETSTPVPEKKDGA